MQIVSMTINKLRISPTPSNTATNTPTMTPSQTNCPDITRTPTPTLTPTMNPICSEQITLFTTNTGLTQYNRTYTRLYSYTGGSFNYAYYRSAPTNTWIFDTLDFQSNYGIVWGDFDGVNYYTLFPVAQSAGNPGINLYVVLTSTTNYLVGSVVGTGTIVDIIPFTVINSVKYPTRGLTGSNDFYVSYPENCPTPTPSVSPTKTPTATPTQTPCIDCYEYYFTASTSGLLSWLDCDGIMTDTFVNNGETYHITCPGARQGTVVGTGTILQGNLCSSTCITPTPTSTNTSTPSVSATNTATPTITPTNTTTPSNTPPDVSPSNTPSMTATNTQTPSISPTQTITPSMTNTPNVSPTNTQTPSSTPTQTATPSITPSPTPTSEATGCLCYRILNETGDPLDYQYDDCVLGATTGTLNGGQSVQVCSVDLPVIDPGGTIFPCTSTTNCSETSDCTGCS